MQFLAAFVYHIIDCNWLVGDSDLLYATSITIAQSVTITNFVGQYIFQDLRDINNIIIWYFMQINKDNPFKHP